MDLGDPYKFNLPGLNIDPELEDMIWKQTHAFRDKQHECFKVTNEGNASKYLKHWSVEGWPRNTLNTAQTIADI